MSLSPKAEALLRSPPARALFAGLRRWHRHELLVLTYHSVTRVSPDVRRGRFAPLYRNAVSARRFEQQMRFLKQRYHVASAADLRAFLDGAPLPGPSVAVTFDDGLLNNYTVAWPILRRLGLPAFFFLPTAFLDAASEGRMRHHWSEDLLARFLAARPRQAHAAGRGLVPPGTPPPAYAPGPFALRAVDALKRMPDAARREHVRTLHDRLPDAPAALPADRDGHALLATMTWAQARRMTGEGAETGAHSVSHAILSRLPEADARDEIRQSVARVAEQTGGCDFFAYPNGTADDFGAAHERALARAGCRGAFTQVRGFNAPAPAHPMALRRQDVSADHGLGAFRYVTSGAKHLADRVLRR